MTTITVTTDESGRILGFISRGHAGANQNGEYDMVCSAVSALTQTAVNALEAVGEVIPAVKVSNGFLSCDLPDGLSESEQMTAEVILKTILTGLKNIEEVYPKYVRVMTKKRRQS